MNLRLTCILLLIAVVSGLGQSAPPLPSATPAKRFRTATVTKQAAQLLAPAALPIPPAPVYVTITIPITNTLQFSPDLKLWSVILVTNFPPLTVSFPMTNGQGWFRNVTGDVYGPSSVQCSTNVPSP